MWHYDRRRDLDLDHYDANFTCVHSGIFLPGMAASADRGIRLPYVTSLRVSLRLCPELVHRPCSHVVYVCAIVNRAEYVRRVPPDYRRLRIPTERARHFYSGSPESRDPQLYVVGGR